MVSEKRKSALLRTSLVLAAVITVASVFYGRIKAVEASKIGMELENVVRHLNNYQTEAERQTEMALTAAAEAARQKALAEEMLLQLKNCQER